MEIIFFGLFIFLNYLSIFRFAEQLRNKTPTITLIISYFLLLGIALVVHTWFLDNTIFSTAARSIIFRIYSSTMVTIFLSFGNRIFPLLIATVISFHRKYNVANLDRNPIKFLIDNQNKIIKIVSSLILLGAVMGMYGIWFD